ncbi:MAG: DNA translocase FtsK, partial [Hyphomicrobiaceae bacterium]
PASAAKVRKPRASAKPRKAKEKVKETARQHLLPIINATLAFAGRGGSIRRPSLDLLRRPGAVQHVAVDAATVSDTAKLLQSALADFGVEGLVRDAQPGPVVTRYEFEPARGTKTARVIGLSEDIARMLSVNAVRIGVIPGKSTLGIEVPNAVRTPVLLREILESDTYRHSDATLPLALGRGINGEAVVADLARMPHLLMAGTTGSGKSVAINSMILSLIYAKSPDQCRLLLIDPKMLELSPYNGIPHLAAPVVTNADEAATALEWAVAEMERRYQLMAKLGVRNIEAFNARARRDGGAGRALVRTVQTGFDPATGLPVFEDEQLDGQPMPYLVIVVDEFADLMIAAGERVETAVQRLSQMARAAGIHLVMATQRPTVDIVTGTIKANMPMRMSFRVASKIDSRTILNAPGAEQLLGQGDMLLSSDGSQMFRVHGTYVADEEVERVAQTLRDAGEPAYISFNPVEAAPPQQPAPTIEFAPDRPAPRIMPEAAYATAVDVVAADRKASPGHLCRRLGLDEDTAAAFIDRMEQEGLVGPPSLLGRRRIIVGAPEFGYQAVA